MAASATLSRRVLAPLLLGSLLLQAACTAVTPLATRLPPGAPAATELDATPFFPQADYQCGPAALATALVATGVDTRPDVLTPQVFLPERGGSLQVEMLGATRRAERLPYVLRAEPDAWLEQVAAGHPVVVMQNLATPSVPRWHYAVVIGYDAARDRVVLRSGVTRREVMSLRSFLRTTAWADHWAFVVLRPGQLPAAPEPSRYLSAAAGLEAAGSIGAAAQAYARATDTWPDQSIGWLGLGNTAFARGRHAEAARAYGRAAALAPTDAAVRNNLAQALAELGCATRARREAEQAVALAGTGPWRATAQATLVTVSRVMQQDGCPAEWQDGAAPP